MWRLRRRADEGTRTPNLLITSELLYQLSYVSFSAYSVGTNADSGMPVPCTGFRDDEFALPDRFRHDLGQASPRIEAVDSQQCRYDVARPQLFAYRARPAMQLTDLYPHRRAFITGAASGLGRALCRQLAGDGWSIGMADVDESALAEAAEEIERAGGRPHRFVLDVTDADAFQTAAQSYTDGHEGVDLVVNNAGIGAGGPFEETSLADWEAVLSVNLMGVIHGCRAFLPHLKANPHGGHLVNVASIAAVAAAPRMSAYNVSKAGVKALSETLYGELKDDDVHVSVLMPAFFETNIGTDMRGPDSAKQFAQTMMQRSDYSADDVARRALQETGRNRIHILMTDWTSRLIWHFQRLLPGTYVKQLPNREREIRKRT